MLYESLFIFAYILLSYKYYTHNRIVSAERLRSLLRPHFIFISCLITFLYIQPMFDQWLMLFFVLWISIRALITYHNWIIV